MLEFRIATMEDVPIVADNIRDAVERAIASGSPMWKISEACPEYVLRNYKLDHIYIPYVDGKPAGSMVLDEEEYPEDLPETSPWYGQRSGTMLGVHKLIARTEFAGQHIGNQMLDFAKAEARRRGLPEVRLNCFDRPTLRDFYVRNGFQLVGMGPMGEKMGAFYIFKV